MPWIARHAFANSCIKKTTTLLADPTRVFVVRTKILWPSHIVSNLWVLYRNRLACSGSCTGNLTISHGTRVTKLVKANILHTAKRLLSIDQFRSRHRTTRMCGTDSTLAVPKTIFQYKSTSRVPFWNLRLHSSCVNLTSRGSNCRTMRQPLGPACMMA